MSAKPEKMGGFNRFLNGIELIGNKLPHPVIIFVALSVLVVIISAIAEATGLKIEGEMINRATKQLEIQTISAVSLLNKTGIRHIFESAVKNFTGFPPLGTVLVAMLGVGVAEGSGLISALLRKVVTVTPRQLIVPVVVFLGVMSNVASDAGYVVLVPIGAIIFASFGRHPLAGLAAAFAGVSGGFSANLIISTLDPLLSGLSQAAGSILDPDIVVTPESNLFFMMISTVLVTALGTFVTVKIIEPRLGTYKGSHVETYDEVGENEKRGLKFALIAFVLFLILIIGLLISGILTDDNGKILGSTPFINGIVFIIMLFFIFPGIGFGYGSGNFKNNRDMVHSMDKSMASMGGYMVLAFMAAQFINYFTYTNLGTILAVGGANFLEAIGFTGLPLILVFILVCAFLNLFIGSASAKWAILAPIFVPMLMKLGYHPAFVQLAYRIGDSTTNIITPLLPYFAVIIAFAEKYDEDAGIGTLTALMLPFSVIFLIGWMLLLVVWFLLGLPIGPGYGIYYIM